MKFIKQSTIIINGSKKLNFRKRLTIAIVLIIIDILLFTYTYRIHIANDEFAKQATEFYRLNAQTVFSIDKVYMYSSANAIDNKDTRAIWNLDLYQYTDIAIYINNRATDKLTYENAIKSLYIDNIKFTSVKKGNTALYYKNINEFGKSIYEYALESANNEQQTQNIDQGNTNQGNEAQTTDESDAQQQNSEQSNQIQPQLLANEQIEQQKRAIETVENSKITDKIEFNILNDGDLDYSKPQLYTDCSNPITLEYVNSKIKENEIISDINSDIVFDGNLLRKSGVVLSDIACTLSFNITLINYYNQKYVATVYLEIPLEDTTTGDNIYKGKFVKKIENVSLTRFFRLE